MPPKNAGGKKGKGGGDDDDGAPKGTCNQIKVRHILCEKHSKVMEAMKELMGYTKDDGTVVEPLKFNVVATKYSEDKAKEGGNLGWKRRDELNGAFAETAFKLAKGGMTAEPLKTKFGYHIILVEDRKA